MMMRLTLGVNITVVFAIYIDSYLFVFTTALLQNSFGVNSSLEICQGAILLCLVCYVTTKASFTTRSLRRAE